MILRNMDYEELLKYTWKTYPLGITSRTTKNDIIRHMRNTFIKTNEVAFKNVPIYIDPASTDIIIIFKNGTIKWGRYNHIYKGHYIHIEYDETWHTWGKVKSKISKIIFMDDINKHESLRALWSEQGFHYDYDKINATKGVILSNYLN